MNKLIVNIQTNETEIVELTVEEIAEIQASIADTENRIQNDVTKADARQAVLDRLGITAEEATLLLS